ncbi:unnamed protein product [Leptosia nina]|uniref:Uncharacterized protein n=1 Tax=Leptosia nina TaxID=320188 RepID=A0AAV1K4P7_9NEOP
MEVYSDDVTLTVELARIITRNLAVSVEIKIAGAVTYGVALFEIRRNSSVELVKRRSVLLLQQACASDGRHLNIKLAALGHVYTEY